MDDPEYTFQILEVFSKVKTKEIPRELEEYISYVARTGDPVFQWSLVKVLIKEKLLAVLNEFVQESEGSLNIPTCPNVEIFNYETMKTSLLNRLDTFILPPFTIQRICELLSAPRKEYNRIDKYMRAVEKNFLVVSASDYSLKRGLDADGSDAVINGILYDKVNDSLNSFTNHVLSQEQDSEMSADSKLDETDAVQQIIDESWNEEHDEGFKLNGSDGSGLNVSFDNELRFADKSTDEKESSCDDESSKELDSSFDNSSMMIEPTIQNIIAESSEISFENVSKSEDSSFEESPAKSDATFEFKDECTANEGATNSSAEVEMFDATGDESSGLSADVSYVSDNGNNGSVDESKQMEYAEFSEAKAASPDDGSCEPVTDEFTTVTEAVEDKASEIAEPCCENSRSEDTALKCDIASETADSSLPSSQDEEPSLCSGDSEKVDVEDKDMEEPEDKDTEESAETVAVESKPDTSSVEPSDEH